jgi:hypothetical protein
MIRHPDIIIAISVAIVLLLLLPRLDFNSSKYINCSTVEFNPDFTPAMREACRQARSGHVSRTKP